jgi:hypothetical protein
MRHAIIAFLLVVVGCATHNDKLVDELESWNGKSEAWVTRKLGSTQSQSQLRQPIPDIGEFQGVQERIKNDYLGYSGEVRWMSWKKKDENVSVFLVNHEGGWVVLDALSWKEGVVF